MNKQAFVEELRRLVSDLPWEDAKRSIEFYSEMIDDLVEEGKTEEDAVAEIGTPAQVVEGIRGEIAPNPSSATTEEKPQRKIRPLTWVLILAGSPLWISLLAAVLAVGVSLVAVALAGFVSLLSVVLALGGAGVLLLISSLVATVRGNLLGAGMLCGGGLFGIGLCILSYILCLWLTKKIFALLKKAYKKIFSYIKERREQK